MLNVPSEIAKLQDTGDRVQEQVLRLDVAMTNADCVDIGQASEQLVHVQLDLQHGHRLLDPGVVSRCTVDSLGDILKHEVKENFILLRSMYRSAVCQLMSVKR